MADPILVGVALDERDSAPVALGLTLARLTTRQLALLHAYPYDPGLMPVPEYQEELRKEALDGLQRLAASLDDDVDVQVYAYARVSPARALQEAADKLSAVALVVGSSPRGRLGRVLAGGIAERLLHGAPCAVGITPNEHVTADETLQRIGVAYDNSEEAQEALDAAIALARAAGASVTTYTVLEPIEQAPALVTPGWVVPQAYLDDRRERAEAAVRAARERVPGELLAGAELLTGNAATLLAEVSSDVDLMACGSRRYGPLRAVLLGATAAQLARTAQCPLLVTPRGHGGELAAAASAAAAAQKS